MPPCLPRSIAAATMCAALAAVAAPAPLGAQTQPAVAPAKIDPCWLTADTATRTARLKLTAGLTPFNGALNFNGYRDGGLTLVVPEGWTVVVDFYNHDGMLPHSAEVIGDVTPVPVASVDPAIPRAYTNGMGQGLPPQAKDQMRFTARPAGEYKIFCGVPGHGLAGMWIHFRVSADAKTATLLDTQSPAPAGR